MKHLILGLAACTSFAHATTHCTTLLGVPEPYSEHFAHYTNPEFVVPLPHVSYQGAGIFRDLKLYSQSLDDTSVDDPQMLSVHARVKVDNSVRPNWLTFESLEISDQLDPEFAYRSILAHLLSRMPDLREIDFDFHALPDYGPVRGRLMRGLDEAHAMAKSKAATVLRDFGFTRLTPQAMLVDEVPPQELILRMRVSRP